MSDIKRVIPGLSVTTSRIIALLADKPEGAEVTYEEISRETGKPKDGAGGWFASAATARRHVLRETGAVWNAVDGVKFRRANNVERFEDVNGRLKSIGRGIRRAGMRATTVDVATLPDADRSKMLTINACLGVLSNVAAPATVKRMESKSVYNPADYLKAIGTGA